MTEHSSLASVGATRERLAELGLSTKKYLGQHFLIDDGVVGRTVRLAALESGKRIVEVGPGLGTLTEALLASSAAVTSVEVDAALIQGLTERYPQIQLINGDALSPQVLEVLQQLQPQALVSNLPYAVAATILLEYFQQLESLESATVMVQREVAERIAAKPGSKEYGSYTIKLGLLTRVADSFRVSPQSFFPPPRVDSTVIRLERTYCEDEDEKRLILLASTLADAAFYQRRKTILNSMKAYFSAQVVQETSLPSKEHVAALLERAGIDSGLRGEVLIPQDFMRLARIWEEFYR